MSEHYDYDVVIIGAGISGLVCGCYLAKAGLKTLIVEKNAKPGGYCTSFTRGGYRFDACVHFLSTLRKESKFYGILNNLGINERISFIRHDPSDIILTPEFKVRIFKNIDETTAEFQKCFPKEKKQIAKFFNFIISTPTPSLTALRSKTLKDLLDLYFSDSDLKTILSVLILGFAGSPPHKISALVACLIYREFVLFDGGYYPLGGMQSFVNALSQIFIDFHGKIIISKEVKKIIINNNKVNGIMLDKGEIISSKYLVSACDARQTFLNLIGTENLEKDFIKELETFTPSLSAFLVYLGMDSKFDCPADLKSNIWVINNLDMEDIYTKLLECKNIHLAITSSTMKDKALNKNTICLTTTAPFINADFWEKEDNRKEMENRLIEFATTIVPGLSKHISLKFNATPLTLYKWTYNYQGAAYGWEGRPTQFGNPNISEKTKIGNLYLAGHWSNMGSGITSVANSGYDTANLILLKENKL